MDSNMMLRRVRWGIIRMFGRCIGKLNRIGNTIVQRGIERTIPFARAVWTYSVYIVSSMQDRVIRTVTAMGEIESVRIGRIARCKNGPNPFERDVYPDVGNHPSVSAKATTRSAPTTKTGVE